MGLSTAVSQGMLTLCFCCLFWPEHSARIVEWHQWVSLARDTAVLRRAALNTGVREEPQEQSTSRRLGYSFFRLSRAPLALSVTLLVAFLTSPLALSVLPSASLRLSPVKLPAASLTAPLTLSAVPEAMNHLQRSS